MNPTQNLSHLIMTEEQARQQEHLRKLINAAIRRQVFYDAAEARQEALRTDRAARRRRKRGRK